MSASSKKKLRNEQSAEKMTQRQLAENKEAKKLKAYTIGFCAILAVLLIITVSVLSYRAITGSGILERSTTAATLGEHKISNAELNYYYIDAVNDFYSDYGSYLAYIGLDATLPLDQQVQNPETGATWADYFVETALNTAKSVYAVADAAEAAGYTLNEDANAEVTSAIATVELYAQAYGYPDTETYLKTMYGKGATMKSYRAYLEMNKLAESYYSYYAESLSYDDAALRAGEAGKEAEYSNYTFNYYLVDHEDYLEGGVTAEDGTTTYTEQQEAAALAAAEADAVALSGMTFADADAFDKAITALSVNESGSTSTLCDDYACDNIMSVMKEWVTDSSRVPGDVTYLPYETSTTAEDGTVSTHVHGYYVVCFGSRNDNNYALPNVRHLLVACEGGTYDSTTNTTTYTTEEKLNAEIEARKLLEKWEEGDKSEKSFADMANQYSDDGDGTTGGLYTEIIPGQMVSEFEDWCFDESREPGDTGLVNSPYGCHIMYYSADSDVTYRDYLIQEDLRAAEMETWYQGLLDKTTVTQKNMKYIATDIVLGTGY